MTLISRDQMAKDLAEMIWSEGQHLNSGDRIKIAATFGRIFGLEVVIKAIRQLELYDQAFPF